MEVKVNVEVRDIMKVLKSIQDYCIKNEGCRNCPFYLGDYECQLRSLFSELDWFPTAWDLEEIECLLKR